MMRPPSSMVGTTPLGFILRYQGWSLPPNAMPTSSRSYFTPHSSAAHSTFMTLIEFARPQIFIAYPLVLRSPLVSGRAVTLVAARIVRGITAVSAGNIFTPRQRQSGKQGDRDSSQPLSAHGADLR